MMAPTTMMHSLLQRLRTTTFRRQLSVLVTVGVLALALLSSLAMSWQSSRDIEANRRQQGQRPQGDLSMCTDDVNLHGLTLPKGRGRGRWRGSVPRRRGSVRSERMARRTSGDSSKRGGSLSAPKG